MSRGVECGVVCLPGSGSRTILQHLPRMPAPSAEPGSAASQGHKGHVLEGLLGTVGGGGGWTIKFRKWVAKTSVQCVLHGYNRGKHSCLPLQLRGLVSCMMSWRELT